jgi:excisionase family DNA binding protein
MTDSSTSATSSNDVSGPRWGELLTAEEVAVYLKCHVSTVYDLVNRGRLKGFSLTGNTQKNKRGKKGLRILATSIDDLVAKGLEERTEQRGGELPHARPEPAVAALPPPVKPRVMKPARDRGSRVVLPFPGGTC